MPEKARSERKFIKWTAEEDSALRSLVTELGEKEWKSIASRMIHRSPLQCLHHWTDVLRPGIVKGAWSAEEDEVILKWVQDHGEKGWTKCAELVSRRSGKQCRERWSSSLNPALKKEGWTVQEKEVLIREYYKVGPKWAYIAQLIPGRCENSVKNMFYSMKRKNDKSKGCLEASVACCPVSITDGIRELTRILTSQVTTAEGVLEDARNLIELRECLWAGPKQAPSEP